MAHQIENMFSVGTAPWHGLGKIVKDAPSIEEAIKLAGLDWKVNIKPTFLQDGTATGTFATVRDTDNKVLGSVGTRYVPLQNTEAFKPYESFIESGMVTLETAGSVREGRRVWVLGKVKTDPIEVAKNDTVELYLLLYHGHDGQLPINFGFTPIRTVCNNTLRMAMNHADSKLLRVRHTKNAALSIEKVKEIINIQAGTFEATIEQYKRLANTSINLSTLEKYVKIVFSQKETVSDSKSRLLDKIVPLFEHGRGNKGKSMWDAYNSVTEYLQYVRGENPDTRLDASWFGQGVTLNQKALEVALEYDKVAA